MQAQTIDKEGLKQRITRTTLQLEKTPAESRRPLYANLIKFVELHPDRIKMGVFAPPQF
jgi:hypothetical protein